MRAPKNAPMRPPAHEPRVAAGRPLRPFALGALAMGSLLSGPLAGAAPAQSDGPAPGDAAPSEDAGPANEGAVPKDPKQPDPDPQAAEQPPEDPRPLIVDIRVQGLQFRRPEVVARRLGLVVGGRLPYPAQATQLQRQLFDDFRILVEREGYSFEEVEGGVVVHLSVVELPYDLDPKFVGNTRFKVEQLREWAELGDRVQVYTDEVEAIADRIQRAYRRQGYHFVEVFPRIGGSGVQGREIVFEIREGPKVYVKSVKITGNDNFESEGFLFWSRTLRKAASVKSKGRGFFAWWGHRYDEEVVEADRIGLQQAYRDRGYLDVVVAANVSFSRDRSGATLEFVVDEGPLYRVRRVDVQAFETERDPVTRERIERPVDLVIPRDEIDPLLALDPGGPFEAIRVQADQRRLLDLYGERGHIESARFEEDLDNAGWRWLGQDVVFDVESKTVDVVYKIQQGRPFTLRFLEVEGNLDTKDHVIRSKIGQLPGALIDGERMRADRARIERTGYFSDGFSRGVHPPPQFTFRTVPGVPDLVDAVMRVEEGRTINANLSGGVASDQGLVGIVSLQIGNFDARRLPRSIWSTPGEVYRKEAFTGNGETFGVDVSPGSEVNYSRIFYQHPDVLARYFDPIGLISEFQLRDRIFRSHDEARTFARLAVTRAFGQGDLSMSIGARWQSLDHSDFSDGALPQTLVNSRGRREYVGLTGSLSYNRLDSARLPRSGYAVRWTNTLYGEAFGSDENLWKSEFTFDRYFHFSEDTFSAAPGVYVGLGAGLAVPIDGEPGSVNYGERFFAGGARVGRGFRFRGIGPYQGEFPIGGETFLRSTFEYRVPLYTQSVPGTSRRRELFRGSLFLDTVTLDPNAYELDLDQTRVSAGIALGLIDPIPVTFSFGWPLREGNGDERQVFNFSLSLR